MQVSEADTYSDAFAEAAEARSGAVLITQATLVAANIALVVQLATKTAYPRFTINRLTSPSAV